MFKSNVFLVRFLPHLYTATIWLNLITSKAFRSSRSKMFYKIGILENFAKFIGKHLCWSYFLIKLHTSSIIVIVWDAFIKSQGENYLAFPYTLFWTHLSLKKRHHRNKYLGLLILNLYPTSKYIYKTFFTSFAIIIIKYQAIILGWKYFHLYDTFLLQ